MSKKTLDKSGEYTKLSLDSPTNIEMFLCEDDYFFMYSLFKKYLRVNGIDGLSFCLKTDSINGLFHVSLDVDFCKIFKIIVNEYNEYFFRKYNIIGIININKCEFMRINKNSIMKVSKEIHKLADDWLDYPHSSVRAYLHDDTPEWLCKDYIKQFYITTADYYKYLLNTSVE